VGLLLLLGFGLRWPGWNVPGLLAGDRETWRHLLAFDALHAIAVALLLAALAFAFLPRTRDRVLAFTLMAALAVTFGLRPPSAPATSLGGIALEQAFGGSSPFPVVPWLVYFVAGGLVGLLAGDGGRRAALAMGLAGAVLGALVFLDVGDMPPAHPVLIGFRIGAVLLLLSLLAAVPDGVARALAPVGRASLAVYAIHVPIVYGWSTHAGLAARIGPALSFAAALGVAACVLAASFLLARAWALARRGAGWAWSRRGPVADAIVGVVGGPRGARD
jgi:hypothetical protein